MDEKLYLTSDSSEDEGGAAPAVQALPWDATDLDSVSEWEDVDLEPGHFTIQIRPQRLRHAQYQQQRQRKVCLRNLGMVLYLTHAHHRNRWLNGAKTRKKLKLILPKVLLQRSKLFWKDPKKSDLNYILKYAIKWFRLNVRINSCGLRVLGYMPEPVRDQKAHDFFPKAEPLSGERAFAAAAHKLRHNRDTAAQFFTCILRVMGFEARMMFSVPLLPMGSLLHRQQPPLDDRIRRNKDNDLLYPYFWTEVVDPLNEDEVYVIETIAFHDEAKQMVKLKRRCHSIVVDEAYTPIYYPVISQFNSMTMHYVAAFTENNTVFDASPRYMSDVAYRYFGKLDLRTISGRSALLFDSVIRVLNNGNSRGIDAHELQTLRELALANCVVPKSFAAMKRSPNFITNSTLRHNEVIPASAPSLGDVALDGSSEEVFSRNCLIVGKSKQQWMMLGRSVRHEELDRPLKRAKRRFKRQRLDNSTSQLYGLSQTEPYIALSVTTTLPRNEYGNIEIYKPWMQPQGTSWLRLPYILEFLEKHHRTSPGELPFVPVVVGFDFKLRPGFAVPIRDGALVLQTSEVSAKRFWFALIMERHRTIALRRQLLSLRGWLTMLRALRIRKRLNEYE